MLSELPRYEAYRVPYQSKMGVLSVLQYIQETLDSSLAFRGECKGGRCGTCGVMVNGKQALACLEPIKDGSTIEPLLGFPILKDLVVNRDYVDERIASIGDLALRRVDHRARVLSKPKLEQWHEVSKCINCLLCVSACPEALADWQRFAGASFFVRLSGADLDSRCRVQVAQKEGVYKCVPWFKCEKVCPAHIQIVAHAFHPLRAEIAKETDIWKRGIARRIRYYFEIPDYTSWFSQRVFKISLKLLGALHCRGRRIVRIKAGEPVFGRYEGGRNDGRNND